MPPHQKVSPFATKNGGSIQQHLALLILPIINGVRTDNRTNKMSLLSLLSSVVSVQFLLSPSKNKSRRYGTHQFERHFVFQFIGSYYYVDTRTQKQKIIISSIFHSVSWVPGENSLEKSSSIEGQQKCKCLAIFLLPLRVVLSSELFLMVALFKSNTRYSLAIRVVHS